MITFGEYLKESTASLPDVSYWQHYDYKDDHIIAELEIGPNGVVINSITATPPNHGHGKVFISKLRDKYSNVAVRDAGPIGSQSRMVWEKLLSNGTIDSIIESTT